MADDLDPAAVEMVREHYRVECALDDPKTRLYRSHVGILLAALAAARDGEAAPLPDLSEVTRYAQGRAISEHARGRYDEERAWLDLLALIERAAPAAPTVTAEQVRADALRLARAWVERVYRPGLVDRAVILADLDEWAERAERGVAPSGNGWPEVREP